MKHKRNLLIASTIIITCVSSLLSRDYRQTWFNPHEGWTLKQQKDGISIYVRWMDTGAGRKIRLMKSAMVLNRPKEQVLLAITRAECAGEWVPNKKEYYHLATDTEGSWLAYTQLQLPWPLKNMDFVVRYTMEDEGEPITIINLQSASGAIPEKQGLKRMKQFTGAWTLASDEQGHTLVMYELCSTLPPKFPRWITAPIVTSNMRQNMEMLRRFVRQNPAALRAAFSNSHKTGADEE